MKVEPTTSSAIKQNLNGIKRISKERIFIELHKILDNKNILNINESGNLREIFSMVFPELLYLKRLERLKKIYNYSEINRDILLAVLLIDDQNNHEYFIHKYNVPNKIKDSLEKFNKHLAVLKNDKEFFGKDLKRNVYTFGKSYLISLNLINYAINFKLKFHDFKKNVKEILKTKVPLFPIDGEFLKKKGMTQGQSLGSVLKILEKEWLNNNFKISDDKIQQIIKMNSN